MSTMICRTPAQLRALRRFAMTWAWDQAYHIVSCYAPGTRDLVTEARRMLARGWVEAKLAETHGHLPVETAQVAEPALAEPVAQIRFQIQDLENRDRLGAVGLQKLASLHIALRQAEALAA